MSAVLAGRIQRLLQMLAQRQDAALILLLILAVFMIVMPLPTVMVDTLIAMNIGLAVLMLIVAVYLRRPVEFSTLPSVILIATLFRLALSISTTRLILLQADAGAIVETFGVFVIGGSLIVGLVIFLIITIAQFLVITKGAERVAEVGARFSLDSLPGKQMSIDSDVRSGEIDMAEARRRRDLLQRESEFYGAMDGAMKFVKGDAIAGLVITAVNLLGGIGVGVFQHDMTMGAAVDRYSLLTVGDGLVAQIPALLISIASGVIVTRVANDDSQNLGVDIAGQLTSEPRSLRIAGLILVVFALIPGFPTLIFLMLAAAFGGTGLMLGWREKGWLATADGVISPTARAAAPDRSEDMRLEPNATVTLAMGDALRASVDAPALRSALREVRETLYEEYGVPFPAVRQVGLSDEGGRFQLRVEDIPVLELELPPEHLLLRDRDEHAQMLGVEVTPGPAILASGQQSWVHVRHRHDLARAGIAFAEPAAAIALAVRHVLPQQVGQFVGVQETRAILMAMESRYPDLVKEVQKHVPLQRLAEVLRRLVEEGVSVRNMRLVLEALVEWGQREKDVVLLVDYVRIALRRQICHRYADANRLIAALLLEPSAEEAMRNAVRHTAVGSYLALDGDTSERLLARLRDAVGDGGDGPRHAVVLTAMDIRRHVRGFLITNSLSLPVLSHQEIAPEFSVQPLVTIGV